MRLWLFLSILVVIAKCQFPKILWTYWEGGKNQTLVQLFIQNHQRFLKNEWQIRVLDNHSIKQYLQKIPYYQGDFDTLDYVEKAHKADYVRCLLLSYYGGVYFDMSIILIEDFSWLQFQNLKNNPDILNRHGNQPEVILFSYDFYGSQEVYFDKSLNKTFEVSPGYEIWFMAAVPNASLVMDLQIKQQQNKGKKSLSIKQSNHKKLRWESQKNSYYLSSLQLLQIMIQRKQHQLDELSKKQNSQRHLAIWYYGIWHIKSQSGPFSVFYHTGTVQAFYLAKYSLQILKYILGRQTIRYLFKFTGQCRRIVGLFMTPNIQKSLQQYITPQKYTIYKDSVLHKYLIENSSFQNEYQLALLIKNEFTDKSEFRELFLILIFLFLSVSLTIALYKLRGNAKTLSLSKKQQQTLDREEEKQGIMEKI